MTRKRTIKVAIYTTSLIAVWSLVSYTGIPRGIKVVSYKIPVGGLTVKMIGGIAPEDLSITDDRGVACFGRGPWAWPGQKKSLIVAVIAKEETVWEGVVACPSLPMITIPIDENENLQNQKVTEPNP